ncbi:MAG: alpha/beta hydrolase [Anaerolineales bacterium]|nr:alpha/beta hydrolase [Anaerolineales bacterium]
MAGWLLLLVLLVAAGGSAWYFNRIVNRSANLLLYPPRSQPSKTPADYGLTAESIQLTSADGLGLTAWFIPPTGGVDGATLIFVHGYSANRGALLDQAVALHQVGYGALLLDLRNHGDSETAVTTWGLAEAADVVAAYNYLLTRSEVNATRIGLVGKSMGGGVVALAATQLPDLRVLVLESSYASLAENMPNIVPGIARVPAYLAPAIFRRMDAETAESLTEFHTAEIVADLHVPLLVIHGEVDKLVPVAQGQAIFAAANEPKQLIVIPGAGHLDIFTRNPETFTEQVATFLAGKGLTAH